MKRPLTEWLDAARRFEGALASHVEGAARSVAGAPPRQPIEIIHAVVDSVAREIEPAGRRHTFPYARVRISLAAGSTKERARLQAVCDAAPSLTDRIADRLALAGCAGQAPEVELTFVETPVPDWSQPEFDIEYASASATRSRASLAIELTITRGSAAAAQYRFATAPVTLGRGIEVRDTRQRVIRVNHVAFADGDDAVNGSVSRQHARIERDTTNSGFRLFDDASAQGTSVIRDGRGIVVPQGMRGLRLQSGDEIVLGQARVQFRLAAAE